MSTDQNQPSLEAVIQNAWTACGGVGDPPPVYVTQGQFEAFVKAGVPAHRLCVQSQIPTGKEQ